MSVHPITTSDRWKRSQTNEQNRNISGAIGCLVIENNSSLMVYPLTGITSYRIQREDDPAVSNNYCFKQNFVPLPAKKDNLKAEILRTTF